MKTYTSTYTPAAFKALATIRNTNVELVEQAIDSVLTDCQAKSRTEFLGVQRIKGEKGEWNAMSQTIARMPAGSVRDCLVYFRSVHSAEKAAKKVNGTIVGTMTDYPASLAEWFGKFAIAAPAPAAAPKSNGKAKGNGKAAPVVA